MDRPDLRTSNSSPRREIQGPRPTPLDVRKDSYKIKKPPVAPQLPQPNPQIRQPVIIYTVSPKVIHVKPHEFKKLVQSLTGSSSSSSSPCIDNSGAISPPILVDEKSRTSDLVMVDEQDVGATVERTGWFPGILSPVPSSLPLISPNFFSPPHDPSFLSFFHDFSPIFHGNKNYMDSSGFMPSPSTFLSAPITSPTLWASSMDSWTSSWVSRKDEGDRGRQRD
ncbi:hypothetical protein HHK36_007933 [Tetracentron sinense]|uniref:VQ domain-containing protein n=1 Tax=Tetracentron sinense TaxID=13715 RepID=A0A835DJJ9_TETSI|nr:hypothetical protein HHK36_007933 [Tetracentron sinense]